MRTAQKIVNVTGMLIVAETEKAMAVIPISNIPKKVDPIALTNVKDAREFLDCLVMWMPKSQLIDVKYEECDMFPNLHVKYPSKYNPDITPYRTSISFGISEWLANEKKLSFSSTDKDGMEHDHHMDNPSKGWT